MGRDVAVSTPVLNMGAVAKAPAHEPQIGRWPGWLRVAILFGAAAGLWVAIGWAAVRIMKLG